MEKCSVLNYLNYIYGIDNQKEYFGKLFDIFKGIEEKYDSIEDKKEQIKFLKQIAPSIANFKIPKKYFEQIMESQFVKKFNIKKGN